MTAQVKHPVRRCTDGDTVALISQDQLDNIKTRLLLSKRIEWKGKAEVMAEYIVMPLGRMAANAMFAVTLPSLGKQKFLFCVQLVKSNIKDGVSFTEVSLKGME